MKRRAESGLAVDLDEAVVLANDAVDGRETEAGALPRTLRREARIEDAITDRRLHPGARVSDLDANVLVVGRVGEAESQLRAGDDPVGKRQVARAVHRVARVDAEVEQG